MTSNSSNMMLRIAELDIDPTMLDEYNALLAEEIQASVNLEPGVLFLYGVAERNTPTEIRVFECYANRAAYEHHITTPHFLKYKIGTAHMVKSLKLIEVDPIALASKPTERLT